MDTRGAVAVLIGAAKLQRNAVLAIEMEEVVALNQGVREFGVRDARAAFTDAVLDELAVEELGHGEVFADFAQEIEIFDVFEPIEVVEHGEVVGFDDALDLGFDTGFVVVNFFERFEVALAVFFGIANLAGGAAD